MDFIRSLYQSWLINGPDHTPIGGILKPCEIARVVIFLVDEDSS